MLKVTVASIVAVSGLLSALWPTKVAAFATTRFNMVLTSRNPDLPMGSGGFGINEQYELLDEVGRSFFYVTDWQVTTPLSRTYVLADLIPEIGIWNPSVLHYNPVDNVFRCSNRFEQPDGPSIRQLAYCGPRFGDYQPSYQRGTFFFSATSYSNFFPPATGENYFIEDSGTVTITVVPEPTTMLGVALAGSGLTLLYRKRQPK